MPMYQIFFSLKKIDLVIFYKTLNLHFTVDSEDLKKEFGVLLVVIKFFPPI